MFIACRMPARHASTKTLPNQLHAISEAFGDLQRLLVAEFRHFDKNAARTILGIFWSELTTPYSMITSISAEREGGPISKSSLSSTARADCFYGSSCFVAHTESAIRSCLVTLLFTVSKDYTITIIPPIFVSTFINDNWFTFVIVIRLHPPL